MFQPFPTSFLFPYIVHASILILALLCAFWTIYSMTPATPVYLGMPILEISYYIFGPLQMVNSLCSVFMTAILLMILFIMFCSSHLGILAGMIGCLSTMPEVGEILPKMSIIHISCMSAQMNPLHCCMGGTQWEDIQVALLPGQTWSDCPDIVTHVFHLKMESLLNEITKKGIFGRTVAHIYTIEFQKCGLPHMHLLIFLDAASRPITPAQIDTIVCAELPDPATEPRLYNIVSKVMIHRPCGAHGNCDDITLDPGLFPFEQWNTGVT